MNKFFIKVVVYLISLLISLYGLSALDYNRFLKKNKVVEAQVLYLVLSFILAYLLGEFFMNMIYYFYI